MSKDISVEKIGGSLSKAFKKVKGYAGFLFLITVLLVYTFLVLRISILSDPKPDETAIAEQTNIAKRLKVDQDAINKILQLEDQNIGVQSLFEDARDNPFQD